MKQLMRLYRYRQVLSGRRAISAQDLMLTMEISKATLKRDLLRLRDDWGVPVTYARDLGGYMLDTKEEAQEMPGLWFDADQLLGLAVADQVLKQFVPGVLDDVLQPLRQRLAQLLSRRGVAPEEISDRLRFTYSAGKRLLNPRSFDRVAFATFARRRLNAIHFNRTSGVSTAREISPQRLVEYHDNWYLDAWCHLRGELRTFSVDALDEVEVLDAEALEIEPAEIDSKVARSYGIFAGEPTAEALIEFSEEQARWARHEVWHPSQIKEEIAGGGIRLRIPYSEDTELIAEILRRGVGVDVLAPPKLQVRVRAARAKCREADARSTSQSLTCSQPPPQFPKASHEEPSPG